MNAFVQSFDPAADEYVKIHVASGFFVMRQKQRFTGIDEVEPLEDDTPKPRQGYVDPLEDMR